MQMSSIQLRLGSLLALGALAVVLLAATASPARGETVGATVPAVVPTEVETAPATVSTEPAPVSATVPATVPSAPASAPEEAPPTAADSVVRAAETQVSNTVDQASGAVDAAVGGEVTRQVRAVAEETTSAAAAPLKSVTDAANVRPAVEKVVGSVQPTVEKVAGSVQPAVEKVAGSVSTVKRFPDELLTPTLSPNAPFSDLSRPGAARWIPAEGPPPLSGPAPRTGGEGPSQSFENVAPLETRPAAGWIDGLDLRGLFAGAGAPDRQAHGNLPASSSDSVAAAAGSQVPSSAAPSHPPLDAPEPASGLSTSASPGPGGGSFFVPIAALLALLALMTPAISRRWKEALAAPVPSRFVCALERPG